MFLTYKPEDGDEQRWTIKLGKLRSLEIEQIEKLTAMDYGAEFRQRLLKGNGLARRALLFTLVRRDHPRTRFADVDFADDELILEMDLVELREVREAVVEAPTLSDDERTIALAQVDAQIAEIEAAGEQVEAEGKAPTPANEGATG